MLLEFTEYGVEDKRIAVNPAVIAFVEPDQLEPEATIIRLVHPDWEKITVIGSYHVVVEMINNASVNS